jgi:tripartite-type tricarboxylate transporter receptor subunit TctC
MNSKRRGWVGALVMATALSFPWLAWGETPYFEGKHITFTISNSPGGGMDATARGIAQLLRKYIPGEPTMIVSNRPGGSHIVGNNWFVEKAQRDGTDILYTASTVIDSFNRGGDNIRFDPRTYDYIAALKLGEQIVFARPQAMAQIFDPSKPPAVVGDTDGLRTPVALTVMAKRYLGQNYRWTIGYPGGNELQLAFQKGEIDVWGTKNQSLLDTIIGGGIGKPVFQAGQKRRTDFPDTPTLWELLDKAGNVPDVEKQAFDFWMAGEPFDHILTLPPATDPKVVAIVREAFDKTTKDPEFWRLITAVMGPSIAPIPGPETKELMIKATTVTEAARQKLKAIRTEYKLPAGE